jgi:hypothetical protein
MNTKICLFTLVILFAIISCKKDDNNSSSIPKFEGITTLDNNGELISSYDSTDWRMNDKFTEIERKLFDTLKFDQTLHLKSILVGNDGIIIKPACDTIARFYPNPVADMGHFGIINAAVKNMNIVIVDSTFTKKVEVRINNREVALNLSSFKHGIYRMYYVFQDSTNKIVGLGHGDIQVVRVN